MPLIQVPVGVPPCQIDDFPEEVKIEGDETRPFERSHSGALHLRPASTKVVSQDELDFLKSARQHEALGARLIVIPVEVVPDKSDRPLAEPQKKEIAQPPAPSRPDDTRPGTASAAKAAEAKRKKEEEDRKKKEEEDKKKGK